MKKTVKTVIGAVLVQDISALKEFDNGVDVVSFQDRTSHRARPTHVPADKHNKYATLISKDVKKAPKGFLSELSEFLFGPSEETLKL